MLDEGLAEENRKSVVTRQRMKRESKWVMILTQVTQ